MISCMTAHLLTITSTIRWMRGDDAAKPIGVGLQAIPWPEDTVNVFYACCIPVLLKANGLPGQSQCLDQQPTQLRVSLVWMRIRDSMSHLALLSWAAWAASVCACCASMAAWCRSACLACSSSSSCSLSWFRLRHWCSINPNCPSSSPTTCSSCMHVPHSSKEYIYIYIYIYIYTVAKIVQVSEDHDSGVKAYSWCWLRAWSDFQASRRLERSFVDIGHT